MIIMSSDIEARIKLEFEKINEKINKYINAPEQERKRKKITNNKAHIESSKLSKRNDNDTTEKKKKLNPPTNNTEYEIENKNVYEIYISKFAIETKEEDIGEYIIDKTKINNPEMFKVSKLKSKTNDNTKNYVSFKIATLREDIYNLIINPKIWEPEFSAREYKQSFAKTERYDIDHQKKI